MFAYLLPGILIGLSAGSTPGPLLTLVISQTIRHGFKEGVKVAIAPFLTDIPIIIIALIALSLVKKIDIFLGIIALLGAGYIVYLAYECFTVKGFEIETKEIRPQSIKKGLLTNVLNPSPYIFYFTVGGAFILKSFNTNMLYGLLFIISFLSTMVLTKIVFAYIVERSRNFFKSTVYKVVNWILGLLLFVYAVTFVQEGLHYLFP